MEINELIELFRQFSENDALHDYGIVGLFLNSLLSATAIPLPTEILTASLLAGGESKLLVGLVLVSGGSVGGIINYWLGFGGRKLVIKIKSLIKKIFAGRKKGYDVVYVDPPWDYHGTPDVKIKEGSKWLKKLGWAGVFFASFIPVAGDLILISAGAKRYDFKRFVILMVSGKAFKVVITILGLGVLFS